MCDRLEDRIISEHPPRSLSKQKTFHDFIKESSAAEGTGSVKTCSCSQVFSGLKIESQSPHQ